MSLLKKIFAISDPNGSNSRDAQIYRNIIRDEAKIGGNLFGPIPSGNRREFFCLDEHTWVWHEEWTDANSVRQSRTTRYDIRPHGIFKAQDGMPYQPLTAEETERLYAAATEYRQRLHEKFDPLLAAV